MPAAKKKKPSAKAPAGIVAATCCAAPPVTQHPVQIADPARAASVGRHGWLWRSGETVVFRFLNFPPSYLPKKNIDAEFNAVRAAFKAWSDTGMGLIIREARDDYERAQIQIAFDVADPRTTWSEIGTDANNAQPDTKTMNFSRTLLDAQGRKLVLHEVGHALGFKHEHQNPTRGIDWNASVYDHFAKLNHWTKDITDKEVVKKFAEDDFEGWAWDPDSIMNYELPAAVMKNRTKPVAPTGLSAGDIERARRFYPQVDPHAVKPVKPWLTQKLDQKSGGQGFFEVRPDQSRKYTITTLGELDVSMSLYEQSDDGVEHYMATDQDAGAADNAAIEARLIAGRRYIVRLRVLYTAAPGEGAFVVY